MKKMYIKKLMLSAALSFSVSLPAIASEVEVLHFWTSGGEGQALNVLKDNLEKEGVNWKDMPVAGGGGGDAMTTLRARVTSGNPPSAALLMGFDLLDWADLGVLSNLNSLAEKENWDAVVPDAVKKFTKVDGKWIAAPLAMHSINWVWANKEVLEKSGVNKEPRTWDEFIAAAEKVKKAGYTALAHGGQAWQEATVFDSVVLATGGAEYYRKAFIDLDSDALASPTMLRIFQRMSQLRGLVDDNFSGRDWNVASSMVISGKAGFQIMGDWAKGEFANANKEPNVDYLCFPMPGTAGSVSFLSNQFAMFDAGKDKRAAQLKMASLSLDPKVQVEFNLFKGAVPARTDLSNEKFDTCAKRALRDITYANKANTLVGSIAHGHAVPAAIKNAFYDVITNHFNGQLSDAEAAAEMIVAVKVNK